MRRSTNLLSSFLVIFSLVSGLTGLIFGLLPYPLLKSAADRLARDGHMQRVTPLWAAAVQLPVLWAGAALLGLAVFLLVWRSLSRRILQAMLNGLASLWQALRCDLPVFRHDLAALKMDWLDGLVLGIILAAAFFVRLVLLPGPMGYDESVTYVDYASRPVWAVLSDYSLPNNHIFHTLMVFLTTRLLGDAPWAIRLPAFLAGLFSVLAAFYLGRSLYRREAGWLAASLVAAWPTLITTATISRGYTLLGLLAMLTFWLGGYLLRHPNTVGWLALAVLGAVGLFTVPVMAYPVGILFTWMLLSTIWKDTEPAYSGRQFLRCLATSAGVMMVLTGLFYTPVLLVSGPGSLFANPFVRSFTRAEYFSNLPGWLASIWRIFISDISPWLVAVLLSGLGLGWIFNRAISRRSVHGLTASALFLLVVLPLQRPEMGAKVFVSLLPLLAVWTAGGLLVPFQWLKGHLAWARLAFTGAAAAVVLMGSLWQAQENLPYLYGAKGETEQISDWLVVHYQPGDVLIADFPIDSQLMYYTHRQGIDWNLFRKQKSREYRRALVAVNPGFEQSLESVLARHPLNPPLQTSGAQPQGVVENTQLYILFPNQP